MKDLDLTAKDLEKLRDALLSAFDYQSLKSFLYFRLEKEIDDFGDGRNRRSVIDALVSKAQQEGWINRLIEESFQFNPGNIKLKAFYDENIAYSDQSKENNSAEPPNETNKGTKIPFPGNRNKILFISYSYLDKGYVVQLEQFLKKHDLNCWMDDRTDDSGEWPGSLKQQLNICAALLVIVSTHSRDSNWVKHEVDHALKNNTTIVPLLLEGDSMFIELHTHPYIDVRGSVLPSNELIEQLKSV